MTYREFLAECGTRLIDPDVALDNELIVEYLASKQDKLVVSTLDTDF